MSRKYYDKLLTSNGTSNKKVKSKFGESILKSMGWDEGKGLGRKEDGMTECIQIQRREEGTGLGRPKDKTSSFRWNDQFWVDVYNSTAAKIGAQDSSSEDESSYEKPAKKKARRRDSSVEARPEKKSKPKRQRSASRENTKKRQRSYSIASDFELEILTAKKPHKRE